MISRLALIVPALGLFGFATVKLIGGHEIGWTFYVGLISSFSIGACLFFSAERRTFVAALVWTIYVGLLGADVFVFIMTPTPREANRELRLTTWSELGVEFDPRTPLEVVRDVRSEGRLAYPMIGPKFFFSVKDPQDVAHSMLDLGDREVLPLSALSNVLIVWCNDTGQYLNFVSDRYGFRNDDAIWDQSSIRIAVLGDSFAKGYCVPSNQSITSRIAAQIPAAVNVSVVGTGSLLQLAILSEVSLVMKPETVIWLYFEGNDLLDLRRELKSPLLRKYLSPSFYQHLFEAKGEIDASLARLADRRLENPALTDRLSGRERKKFRWVDFLLVRHLRIGIVHAFYGPHVPSHLAPIQSLTDVLEAVKERVEAWNGNIVFVYLPGAGRFRSNGDSKPPFSMRDEILEEVGELGIPTLDLSRVFAAELDPIGLYTLAGHGHYTSQGYKLVSDEILAFLRTDPFFEDPPRE